MLESVPRGTLFLMPGQSGFYVDLPMNREAALSFIQELAKERHGNVEVKSPELVVQHLVRRHGLVVVNKEDREIEDNLALSVNPESHRFRLANGGLLDLENVKAYIENGRINPDTGLTIVDQSSHVIGPIKAKHIKPVKSFFHDYWEEPQTPPYTVVASSMSAISGCFEKIVDQFGLKDTDPVALTTTYGDNSTEKVVRAGGLHA